MLEFHKMLKEIKELSLTFDDPYNHQDDIGTETDYPSEKAFHDSSGILERDWLVHTRGKLKIYSLAYSCYTCVDLKARIYNKLNELTLCKAVIIPQLVA